MFGLHCSVYTVYTAFSCQLLHYASATSSFQLIQSFTDEFILATNSFYLELLKIVDPIAIYMKSG